jgi:nicotinate-nucleotide adenylyltransferase
MRVGVYGGSFDPPHVGHLMVSCWLRWVDRVDAVWWVPVRGHAFDKRLAPWEVRLAWCRAAIADLPWVSVCAIEDELPVPSYTVDTLGELARRFPEHAFRLVVGADVLPDTARWKDWDGIAARWSPIVVGRVGHASPQGTVEFPGVSSTEIRRRAAAGEPVDALVPAAIRDDVARFYATNR